MITRQEAQTLQSRAVVARAVWNWIRHVSRAARMRAARDPLVDVPLVVGSRPALHDHRLTAALGPQNI
ncbi:MAG: hypothetical protein M1574_04190 [Gammaproteobacteria bacterium]|nr:hypothetical protein [Gammaproteobacteria bacterium]